MRALSEIPLNVITLVITFEDVLDSKGQESPMGFLRTIQRVFR